MEGRWEGCAWVGVGFRRRFVGWVVGCGNCEGGDIGVVRGGLSVLGCLCRRLDLASGLRLVRVDGGLDSVEG